MENPYSLAQDDIGTDRHMSSPIPGVCISFYSTEAILAIAQLAVGVHPSSTAGRKILPKFTR